ncbi:MAG TPA: colanic acid biosynthesis glycosyltransferase WcaL, partial [Parvularcula sp.]|nr:colanic acid biosynthesis glycosyltransferase WcaL [Parvularcula sp.]
MNGAAPILVLVKRFPKLSETFILNEILSLEAAGLDLEVRTLFAPSDEFSHPDAARVRANIGELKPGSIRASFSRAPLATLRALAASVLAA